MQIRIVFTQLPYILKKNGILSLKNDRLKHADFASQNGGNRVSENLKFKTFPGEDATRNPPCLKPGSAPVTCSLTQFLLLCSLLVGYKR